jgi:hypothetical protein
LIVGSKCLFNSKEREILDYEDFEIDSFYQNVVFALEEAEINALIASETMVLGFLIFN